MTGRHAVEDATAPGESVTVPNAMAADSSAHQAILAAGLRILDVVAARAEVRDGSATVLLVKVWAY